MAVARSPRRSPLAAALAALVLAGGPPAGIAPASAQEGKPWEVRGDLLGERKKGGFKDSEDVSGMACAATELPRVCIVVDDETQGAQVVILRQGELVAGDFIPLISNTFEKDPLELDAEGVAFADGAFYVIGSHGRPRREQGKSEDKNVARAEATRRVFRIVLAPGAVDTGTGKIKHDAKIADSAALGGIIRAQPKLAQWFDEALKDNGLTIEGVAARDGKLYVGMRGPVLPGGRAVILEAPVPAVFDGQKGDVRLHELELGGDSQGGPRGVRDLVPHGDGFLVLAGPVNDPKDDYDIREGDYTVFAWRAGETRPDGAFQLPGFGPKVKPEAIVPLEEKPRSFRALLLFDGPDNGRPTPVQVELR